MKIKISVRSNTLIVFVSGELDQHNAPKLREQTDLHIMHTNVKNLVFDFSDLEFMDSSGIGVIIGRYKLMQALNGMVAVVCRQNSVKKVLELSGIRRIIKICDTLSDAMKIA